MGKRPRSRVKGSSKRFRSLSHRALGKSTYWKGKVQVIDIVHTPERTTPTAKVRDENGKEMFVIPAEGIQTGEWLFEGSGDIKQGNVLPLSQIPEGIPIFNIESFPGDNGRYVRSSGTFATIHAKNPKRCIVTFPSKKTREFPAGCRATIGVAAGGGRPDKPFVKAGKRWYDMRSKGKLYPITSGSKMNPLDHPWGGKAKPGWPTMVKRDTPPGAKVGHIAARRTGRKNK